MLDWTVIRHICLIMFVAELGDKTQLLAVAETAEHRTRLSVFLGALLGLALVTLIGVVFGKFIGDRFPRRSAQIAAGVFFVVLGALMILGRIGRA